MERKSRLLWPDALRIVAALMVIMIHTASPLFTTNEVGSGAFAVGWVLDCLSQAAVPLFVMVSGMFMLDEGRPVTIRRVVRRYALPMVGLFFLWSGVYAVANKVAMPLLVEGATFNGAMVAAFFKALVEGAYHLWYLPMTVGLYLLTPLLRTFVHRDNPRPAVYFVLLSLVFGFGVPAFVELFSTFTPWPTLAETVDKFRLNVVAVYPGYYVAGWLIAGWQPTRRQKAAVYAAGGVGIAGSIALTGLASYRLDRHVAFWMEPGSLLCAGYAVALFCLFCWELGSRQPHRLMGTAISRLSRLTFGVYVIHVEIQALFKLVFPYSGFPLIYAIVQWAVVAVAAFVAAWVLGLIPGLRRTVRG